MESAVGMQLRSKASPADSIIQSATLHCRVGSAKCCWLGCQSAMLRQQTRRPARGLCKPLSRQGRGRQHSGVSEALYAPATTLIRDQIQGVSLSNLSTAKPTI